MNIFDVHHARLATYTLRGLERVRAQGCSQHSYYTDTGGLPGRRKKAPYELAIKNLEHQ